MGHLNNLNVRLQGKNCIFPILFGLVSSFITKLVLFLNDFTQKRLTHFTRMRELASRIDKAPNYDRFKNLITLLHSSFNNRFADFQEDKKNVELFTNPFLISVDDLNYYSPEIQTEIIDLQHHTALTNKYKEIISTATNQEYIEFWKFVPKSDFPNLHDLTLRYCCRFGSTYVCEQIFSVMNVIKTKYRSKLTDTHLKHLILLSSSKVNPNLDELIKNIQIQKPH